MTGPLRAWPYADYPDHVRIEGHLYQRARYRWGRKGVIQYREARREHSRHLYAYDSGPNAGTYQISHVDRYNPDFWEAWRHLWYDVLQKQGKAGCQCQRKP